MSDRPQPEFRIMKATSLVGTMAVYDSQAEAAKGIPEQWRRFLEQYTGLGDFYGASPCTNDRKIHYLAGFGSESSQSVGGEFLTLEAGEYAVVQVDDPAQLRDTWVWLLTSWLANSGRREKHAPEFERYTRISEGGTPNGPVEIWIPLQPNNL
jgi:predicted transcriptional regulator YdeE